MLWQTKGFRLKTWLRSFFFSGDNEAQKRGEDSESRVFKVIQEMLVWKELPTHKKGVHPYRTEKWSAEDRVGIDIIVPTKRGNIFIQVKSSSFGWSRFVSQRRNRDIICINGQDTEVEILKELRKKLTIAYNRLPSGRI